MGDKWHHTWCLTLICLFCVQTHLLTLTHTYTHARAKDETAKTKQTLVNSSDKGFWGVGYLPHLRRESLHSLLPTLPPAAAHSTTLPLLPLPTTKWKLITTFHWMFCQFCTYFSPFDLLLLIPFLFLWKNMSPCCVTLPSGFIKEQHYQQHQNQACSQKEKHMRWYRASQSWWWSSFSECVCVWACSFFIFIYLTTPDILAHFTQILIQKDGLAKCLLPLGSFTPIQFQTTKKTSPYWSYSTGKGNLSLWTRSHQVLQQV